MVDRWSITTWLDRSRAVRCRRLIEACCVNYLHLVENNKQWFLLHDVFNYWSRSLLLGVLDLCEQRGSNFLEIVRAQSLVLLNPLAMPSAKDFPVHGEKLFLA